jgi:iron complex outermembrane receptor protein
MMHQKNNQNQTMKTRITAAVSILTASLTLAHAQAAPQQVVVSASRAEQSRFDAPAAIDVVQVDPFLATSPLVNLSELLSAVPGVQVRNRENYAQDLQVSVRGFGTRSTFGVRGVRILVDGIPATMPDGQGQAATANLNAAARIEVLRGPLAQLYGNAAGGVVQVFTQEPPQDGVLHGSATAGVGSDGQRQIGASLAGGTDVAGATLDVSRYSTDGYRDHSAAKRTLLNGKVVLRPSKDTKVTTLLSLFDQPETQDPLGLSRADFEQNPRQVIPNAIKFNTRKNIAQKQVGIVVEHQLSEQDMVTARVYDGTRQINQKLAFRGGEGSSGGVIDLEREYGGVGVNWHHKMRVNNLPLSWTLGVEADNLREQRRGFDNNSGTDGALRRDEISRARNRDIFAQADWAFARDWRATLGARQSTVKLAIDDRYSADSANSGSVEYRNTSPVAGLVWSIRDDVNLYANIGKGFETPTLAESAYRAGDAPGPNLGLRPSTSVQAELGAKIKRGNHAIDLALFDARSDNEIVPTSLNGRSTFENVDNVRRRGIEASWQAKWDRWSTRAAYTWLDARFRSSFSNAQNATISAGNRLPGAPQNSLYADVQYQVTDALSTGLDMRTESRVFVNDVNADAAAGYALVSARAGYAFKAGNTNLFLYGRIDNVLDKQYAGSVIVNDGNGRFFEPAPGRRLFVGLRGAI